MIKDFAKQSILWSENILCKVMDLQKHDLFKKEQNIYVAVCVASNTVGG